MASGDTKTNQYLDIAANGTRADLPADTCCETRSQTLIRGVAERVMDVEDKVEEIINNPDVVDIVATYADLQAYDVTHLHNKDVIRVLTDETHDGNSTYYRLTKPGNTWTYIGMSKAYSDFVGTDGTTAGTSGLVPAPATTDAGKFLKADGTWDDAGSSVNIVQTTGTSQTDVMSQNATTSMVYADPSTKQKVQIGGSASGDYATAIGANSNASDSYAMAIGANSNAGGSRTMSIGNSTRAQYQGTVIGYSATSYGNYDVVIGSNSKGSGTSLSSGKASSVVIGADAGTPTSSVGNQVLNATTCVGYGSTGATSSTTLGYQAKSNGTGDQGVSGIAIGHSSTNSGRGGVVIGRNSSVTADGGIALGILSSATTQGEMNIGTSSNSYGYNSSNYRLITGVYDPQTAHDAATKGYVDAIALGSNESYTIATSDWTALSSSAPYTYQATVTATTTLTNNSILELINDNAVSFATYGFAIGSVDVANNQMAIYSVGQPSASVTLTVNIK